MFLIYTPHTTNRIRYIFQYVFEEKFGLAYTLTNDAEAFLKSNISQKIVYAKEPLTEGVFIAAHTLLFDEGISEIELQQGTSNNIKTIFALDKTAALNFDVFAAMFYLLSRYEEYLGKPLIQDDNYNYKNSILYVLNTLDTPVVEQWLELLKDVFTEKFPSIKFKKHSARVGLSFDVDVAYAYKAKGFARTIGSLLKKILFLKFGEANNQLQTILNRRQDMYDTYDYVFDVIKNKKPVYFFNMGERAAFDKNPSWKNKKFRQLIQYITSKSVVGLHPSYASNANEYLVTEEKNKLESISGKSITISRQHYLKLKFPDTYNNLIANNIWGDYTMGYYYTYGFRAGTCNSFLFFDLKKNETTTLRLYPYAYMDGTLNDILKMSIEKAKATVSRLIDVTYKYDGIFISLWHNSTLYNRNEWKGWREVFEHTVKEVDNKHFENLF